MINKTLFHNLYICCQSFFSST